MALAGVGWGEYMVTSNLVADADFDIVKDSCKITKVSMESNSNMSRWLHECKCQCK